MFTKSPSGSACPYYYMGGELHPLKYGSYYTDKKELFAVMRAEEAFILKSAGQYNRRIWIDLYNTRLDDETILALIHHIKAIRQKIRKLCFVGCSYTDQRKIRNQMIQDQMDIADQIRFFSDPELAKQWLVDEKNS